MKDLSKLEQASIDMLLKGDNPVLVTLRAQLECARLVKREYTGVGFFLDFEVPHDAPSIDVQGDFRIGDVYGELEGLEHGAGFILLIKGGRMSQLECFTFEEPWPSEEGAFTLSYHKEPRELELPEMTAREESVNK